MTIENTFIDGLKIIIPEVFGDNRGWFFESYSEKKFADKGIHIAFVQDGHSFSAKKGVLKGLHFQLYPMAQAKLVRCTQGRLLDVAVDLRSCSPTYKKWFSIELSKDNKKQLLIPRGFAHGFLALADNTEVQYKLDNLYSKEHDRSIRYDDSEINIDWGYTGELTISDKDMNAPFFADSDVDFK
ncbi:MAG: dTDP-4-dehydrorhamnose 3,5-epimerase [Defluviitaleaceae bacterium]|nr:dTDP-4-dehydrorhamnose 3,5-epimerase [Defluviitaleaceae bacterium]